MGFWQLQTQAEPAPGARHPHTHLALQAGCFPYGSCLSPKKCLVLPSLGPLQVQWRGSSSQSANFKGTFFFFSPNWKGIANVLFASWNLIRKLRQLHFNRGPDSASIQNLFRICLSLRALVNIHPVTTRSDTGVELGAGKGAAGETKQPRSPQPQTIPDRCERGAKRRPPLGLPKSLRDGPGEPPPEVTEPLGGDTSGSGGGSSRPRAARGSRLPAQRPGRGSARWGWGSEPPPGGLQEAGRGLLSPPRGRPRDGARRWVGSGGIQASAAEIVAAFRAEAGWGLHWGLSKKSSPGLQKLLPNL